MKTKYAYKSLEGKAAVLSFYDTMLGKWSLPYEKIWVPTQYGQTFVVACGSKDAPPLVLLHGTASNSLTWLADMAQYAKHYRVFAVDIPGEAGHSAEIQWPLKGTAYAEWLNGVFKGLSLDKAMLVGFSLGAWMAILYSARYPEKVSRLALISPAGVGRFKIFFLPVAIFFKPFGKWGMSRLMRYINSGQSIPESVITLQMLAGEHVNFRKEAIPKFSDGELKRLTMPVALFVGEDDVLYYTQKAANRLGKLLPHAEITILPHAGHMLLHLADLVGMFLKKE